MTARTLTGRKYCWTKKTWLAVSGQTKFQNRISLRLIFPQGQEKISAYLSFLPIEWRNNNQEKVALTLKKRQRDSWSVFCYPTLWLVKTVTSGQLLCQSTALHDRLFPLLARPSCKLMASNLDWLIWSSTPSEPVMYCLLPVVRVI